jgi:hypothetical protein
MKCFNPDCGNEELYFRGGTLHFVDRVMPSTVAGEHRQVVWLCPRCSPRFAIQTWRPAGEQFIRRERSVAKSALLLLKAA